MIPENVKQLNDARIWELVFIGFPLIIVGLVIFGIGAWIYQNYYDN